MVTVKSLNFKYRRNTLVLDDIDMQLKSGHIYGLLGKNGEGKTTLLNVVSGQLFPQKGECLVFGDIPGKRNAHLLQQLFLLPEEITLPDVTAEEYISMYAPFYPTYKEDIKKTCFEAFEVDASVRVSKMSLGQRKKVAISLALAVHTPLLLMDEPTNGLDIPSKVVFRKLIATSIEEHQTVVISTHQVRDLESLIDSVIILDNRKILLNRSLEEISDKLSFRLIESNEKALYSEVTSQGLMGVLEKGEEADTPVSLELLFNAAISNRQEVKRMFHK